MTPGTAAARHVTEHYSRIGTDPAKPLGKQLEEGMVISGDCVILTYFNLKRGRDIYIIFPSRPAAVAHLKSLIAEKAADKNRAAIRAVVEALA